MVMSELTSELKEPAGVGAVGLTYSCLKFSWTNVVWIYNIFENNLGFHLIFTKYLMESCMSSYS